MAELVDAPASGAGTRKGVEVRVLFWAPFHFEEAIFLNDHKILGMHDFSPPGEENSIA
jgi:hypothetical protein